MNRKVPSQRSNREAAEDTTEKPKVFSINSKVFSQRFNRELAASGFPDDIIEKTKAVSIVFDVSRHQANAMIYGQADLKESELDNVAKILEVCPQWLSGATDRRKLYPAEIVEG